MYLVIDVSILKKALIHQDQDRGLHCRNIWDYSCQFAFIHICFDEDKKIDGAYESALSSNIEYRKWYTEQLPRKYATNQPFRFCGTTLGQIPKIDEFYSTLLSVAKNAERDKTIAIVDNNEIVITEAGNHSIICLESMNAHEKIKKLTSGWLRSFIEECFDENELKILCADLGIRYGNLEGGILAVKIIELVQHFDRRGQLNELAAYCKEKRPNKCSYPC